MVELDGEAAHVRTVPLKPLRDMAELRGTYAEVSALSFDEGSEFRKAYLHITLLDEEDVPDAAAKLRVIYPFLMKLSYDNRRTRSQTEIEEGGDAEKKPPLELFGELYEKQNGAPMGEEQLRLMETLIEKIWEEDV